MGKDAPNGFATGKVLTNLMYAVQAVYNIGVYYDADTLDPWLEYYTPEDETTT